MLIYEDVHWLDATSQEALDLLVPRLRDLPVLVIISYRPEYLPRWSDQAHVTLLTLNRLGRRQAAELVTRLTSGSRCHPCMSAQSRTGYVPVSGRWPGLPSRRPRAIYARH